MGGWGGGLFLRGGGERGGKEGGKYGGFGDICGRVITFIQFMCFYLLKKNLILSSNLFL